MKINELHWIVAFGYLEPNNFGQTNYDKQTITINNSLCMEGADRTLIHEIVHAYCYSNGYCYKKVIPTKNFASLSLITC